MQKKTFMDAIDISQNVELTHFEANNNKTPLFSQVR